MCRKEWKMAPKWLFLHLKEAKIGKDKLNIYNKLYGKKGETRPLILVPFPMG